MSSTHLAALLTIALGLHAVVSLSIGAAHTTGDDTIVDLTPDQGDVWDGS